MGHRIANHRSICRGLHGHRYKAEIYVEGKLVHDQGASEEGMVMDFADIKKVAHTEILERLDHAFMVHNKDAEMIQFFESHSGHKPVIVTFIPTAENVAKYIFTILEKKFKDVFQTGLRIDSIKLWETPTSNAVCKREDIQ